MNLISRTVWRLDLKAFICGSSIIAACLMLSPAAAIATIHGTAHVFEYGSVEPGGYCGSLCHTYLDLGSPLSEVQQPWLASLPSGSDMRTESAVCALCHRSDGVYGTLMISALSDHNVYGTHSHGRKMRLSNPPPGTDAVGSGLPYVYATEGHFECTTCHNPHDDSYRPFLRADINVICARCHARRNYVGGTDFSGPMARAGLWGMDSNTGEANPGSHPVGNDVTENTAGGPPVTIGALFRIPFSPQPAQWSLGPHLSEGSLGGVTCLTCHAVHGLALDREAYGDSALAHPPNPLFLATPQAEGTVAGYGRTVANGAGHTNSLCESCHSVHPGRPGLFSHPTDSFPSGTDMGVEQFPEGWPEGDVSIAGQNVSPTPICETCHVPHPEAAVQAGRRDVITGAGAFILRAPVHRSEGGTVLCDNCHSTEMADHHPINRIYDSSGVPYLRNAGAGPGDVLTCSTCHWGAHNWAQPGWAGLDPSWLPYDNGRDVLQAEDMYNPDMSKTCMDCHYFMDGDGASVSPTLGPSQSVIDPNDAEYEHYQAADRSMGTHYIGRIHQNDDELIWLNEPIIDMFDATRTWREQRPDSDYTDGLADGWSRFGGENTRDKRVIVCESCHELEPDRNRGFNHLLLAPYEEGRNGAYEYGSEDDGRDILCESCHGNPEGSHPMTGSIVSRTDETLNIEAGWVREEFLGYATAEELWGKGLLSCDSCHQPHDANSNSRTFCLDVPEELPEAGLGNPAIKPGKIIPGYGELVSGQTVYREADGSPGTYTTPRDDMVSFTGNCLQCHDR